MYWYGEAATSSARLYYEGPFGQGEAKLPEYAEIQRAEVTIPIGFACFPKEISWPPRSWRCPLRRCVQTQRQRCAQLQRGKWLTWPSTWVRTALCSTSCLG